ncbi:MAG: hypothetical protein GX882_00200 [Methanomicrobiales archaeon]|nr:hypothetical protein [Methanomicrobiales archaeon]
MTTAPSRPGHETQIAVCFRPASRSAAICFITLATLLESGSFAAFLYGLAGPGRVVECPVRSSSWMMMLSGQCGDLGAIPG